MTACEAGRPPGLDAAAARDVALALRVLEQFLANHAGNYPDLEWAAARLRTRVSGVGCRVSGQTCRRVDPSDR